MKITPRKTLTLIIFTLISCLPFIHINDMMGIELFLDSFENSDNYICLQDRQNNLESNTFGDYLIIQKASHPEFKIEKSDLIIYCDNEGDITFTKVNHINSISAMKRYYVEKDTRDLGKNVIFENQILGKIIEIVDENIINSISVKIWETSIHNLNIRAILID
ncbi:hypothetical protein AYK21_00640 [Thermoplasmatales archaeon SG8-52-2]|nr:MAG: hypothetical protein AYK21_00640 [Thermoplasmatales archaeon SG8-52-2]